MPGIRRARSRRSTRAFEASSFRFRRARRALEGALAKDPKDPSANGNFALFHLNMGEPDRAILLLMQALSLYPKGKEFIFANWAVPIWRRAATRQRSKVC